MGVPDYHIDQILDRLERKKKVNSGLKGNRGENGVIDLLTERFNMPFSRVPDSGARMSQVALPEELKAAYTGDIVVPPGFLYCIECKNGYDDVNVENILLKGRTDATIDGFLAQAEKDAGRVNKKPMLCWKKTGKPFLAFTRDLRAGDYGFFYRDWVACHLKEILKLPDEVPRPPGPWPRR